MPIKMIRVDDRLVHGQVVLSWSRKIGIDTLLLANDYVATDMMTQSVMSLAVPPGVELVASSIEEMAEQVNAGKWDDKSCFLIVKNSIDLLRIYKAGLKFERANVGNAGGGTGKVRLLKHCAASPDELEAWHELNNLGITLTGQWVPDEKEESLNEVLNNLKETN